MRNQLEVDVKANNNKDLAAVIKDLLEKFDTLQAKIDADHVLINALEVKIDADHVLINALLAQLDADAGVTDTDYVSNHTVDVDYVSTSTVDVDYASTHGIDID